MKKLNAQEVEQILNSPVGAVTRVLAQINRTQEKAQTNFEARVKSFGIEVERGSVQACKNVFESLKSRKLGCEFLVKETEDSYIIHEEYLR